MGRVRVPIPRRGIPRSRVPLHRRVQADPAGARRWLAVAAASIVTAALVGHAVDQGRRAADAWGRRRPVLVTTRTVRAGTPLAGAVHVERWPVALVPPAALGTLPTGAWAAGDLDEGMVVSRAAVRGTSRGAGRRRTIALRAGDAPLPVREGDRVDVWATQADAQGPTGTVAAITRRLATGAVVVAAGERTVVVAVAPTEVAAVARAASLATVTLVGSG